MNKNIRAMAAIYFLHFHVACHAIGHNSHMLVWICTALKIPSDLGLTILSNLDEPCLCERGICICMGFESPVILLPKMEGVKDKYIILPNIL